MALYHVELKCKTNGRVLQSKTTNSEVDASETAQFYIRSIKNMGNVVSESDYDISPRGFIIGQTLYTNTTEYVISTAKRS